MQIKEILREYGFTCSKRYGQNFLSDPQLLRAIAEAGAEKGDTVLEVGAGAGTLTHALWERGARVTTFEIDEKLRPVLARTLADTDVRVIFADVMDYDISSLGLGDYRLVANLPYYITTPVIFRFLYDEHVLSLTIMVQKEVAERICAAPGTPAYGALSAQMQAMGQTRILRTVPRGLFYPAPEVDSAVVRLDIAPIVPREALFDYRKVVAAAFAMRRKTLANNLAAAYPVSKADAARAVADVCGDPVARGETFSPPQFLRLAKLLRSL